jgi:hypothetical protein
MPCFIRHNDAKYRSKLASDIQYNADDDERTKIMQEILESSMEGLTKQ